MLILLKCFKEAHLELTLSIKKIEPDAYRSRASRVLSQAVTKPKIIEQKLFEPKKKHINQETKLRYSNYTEAKLSFAPRAIHI